MTARSDACELDITPRRRRCTSRAGAALAALLAVLGGTLASTGVAAQDGTAAGDRTEVRIVARKLDTGRIEFGLQQRQSDDSWGERQLPRVRFFPTTARVNRWLASSPLDLPAGEVRIVARKLDTGRIEFGLQQRQSDDSWGERQLPRVRFFPTTAGVNRWLASSPLEITAPQTTAHYPSVTLGSRVGCALRSANDVACWGYNDQGYAAPPPAGAYTAVSAGGSHVCALRTDNTLLCWRYFTGQQTDAPTGTFTAVSAGGSHSCALRADNTIACWGDNGFGQAEAPAGQFTAVSAGESHSCALRADNTITCWGDNGAGQAEAPAGQFTAVSAGGSHSCALRADNTIACWGTFVNPPAEPFAAVSAGGFSPASCAVRANGEVTCWGEPTGFG